MRNATARPSPSCIRGELGVSRWLAVVRALHGTRPLRPGARLLQRRQHQDRQRRGLRHRAGGLGALQPLRGAPVRAGARPPPVATSSNSAPAPGAWPRGSCSALAQEGPLPERYLILEVSADLAARQRALLAALPAGLRARVVWLERLPPAPMRGVMLANEVADALPCRRFVYEDGAVRELGVALDAAGAFHDAVAAADPQLRRACAAIVAQLEAPLPEGYVSEACLRASALDGEPGRCAAGGCDPAVRLRPAAAALLPPAARARHAALPLPAARAR